MVSSENRKSDSDVSASRVFPGNNNDTALPWLAFGGPRKGAPERDGDVPFSGTPFSGKRGPRKRGPRNAIGGPRNRGPRHFRGPFSGALFPGPPKRGPGT